jgi:hypothetical protein
MKRVSYPIININDATGYNRTQFLTNFTTFCETYLRTVKFMLDEEQEYEHFDTLTKTSGFMSEEEERMLKSVFEIKIEGDRWYIAKSPSNAIDLDEITHRVNKFKEEHIDYNQNGYAMTTETTTTTTKNFNRDFEYIVMFFVKIVIFALISFVLFNDIKNKFWT